MNAGREKEGDLRETSTLDQLAHHLLRQLALPLLDSFLDSWPLEPEVRRSSTPQLPPVLRALPEMAAGAPRFSAKFLGRLARESADLCWRQTYREGEVSAAFLDGYAYAELVGLSGALPSERLACGVLLLGPDINYPAHHHEAEEIYVVLSGVSLWQKGTEPWQSRVPGELIHHVRHEAHAMRTQREPMLAIYLWRSGYLAQKSQLL